MLYTIMLPVGILTALGVLFGAGLAWAVKVFEVHKDPRIVSVRDALPGANCGACGHPGCDGLAAAIVEDGVSVNACPVGGTACAQAIAEIMGVEAEEMIPMVAAVICQGATDICHNKYAYGEKVDCKAAVLASGGGKACRYACLGLGTCATACPFDAITMSDGLARIDHEKCTGCGACTSVCPKNVLRLEPFDRYVTVRCRATEKGKIVRDACKSGCIACSKCFKACEYDAIIMKDNLPIIKFDKCVQCGACAVACPTGAMSDVRGRRDVGTTRASGGQLS